MIKLRDSTVLYTLPAKKLSTKTVLVHPAEVDDLTFHFEAA
jgi:hypothetical protein